MGSIFCCSPIMIFPGVNSIRYQSRPFQLPAHEMADAEKWRIETFHVNYGKNLEKLRVSLKRYITDAGVRSARTDVRDPIWYDPGYMLVNDEKLEIDGLYFLLTYDSLASVKLRFNRIVGILERELVLIDNLSDTELDSIHINTLFRDNSKYLGDGKYTRMDYGDMLKDEIGYCTQMIPQENVKVVIDLLRPLKVPEY